MDCRATLAMMKLVPVKREDFLAELIQAVNTARRQQNPLVMPQN